MAMNDQRVGALARAVRHRLGWTQAELGRRAGVSQELVSVFERGHLDEMTVRSARLVAARLDIHLPFDARWRGGDGLRLLDQEHAALVNAVVRRLARAGWEIAVEYSFNHYGERGVADAVGWHAATGSLVIVEAKSRLVDTQDTLAALDRKRRVLPGLVSRDRGWHARNLGVVLAMAELTVNRRVLARHSATFAAALPHRTVRAKRWIRGPAGRLSAVWFLPITGSVGGKRRKRVRTLRAGPTIPRSVAS